MDDTVRWRSRDTSDVPSATARTYLEEVGVPRETLLFEASLSLGAKFTTVSGQRFKRIGEFDETFQFLLDVDNGDVYFGLMPDEAPVYVNSSLERFSRCLAWVDQSSPFYMPSDSFETKEGAGSRVAEFIQSVDSACLDYADGFWNSFIHDVSIGDYCEGAA